MDIKIRVETRQHVCLTFFLSSFLIILVGVSILGVDVGLSALFAGGDSSFCSTSILRISKTGIFKYWVMLFFFKVFSFVWCTVGPLSFRLFRQDKR